MMDTSKNGASLHGLRSEDIGKNGVKLGDTGRNGVKLIDVTGNGAKSVNMGRDNAKLKTAEGNSERHAAIEALSTILWGFTAKETIEILNEFFPEE